MSGNPEQGKKAANTIKDKYGADFYAKIGAKGGSKGTTGGFAWMRLHDPKKLKAASSKGGKTTNSLET